MVELLIGKKGAGKTKALIEKVNAASSVASGDVVFICKDLSSIYDIKSKVRMCETHAFGFSSYRDLLFFINGIISSNYDITNVFIDGIFKIIGTDSLDGAEDFINAIQSLSSKYNVSFVVSMSIDANDAPDYIKALS